MITNTMIYLLGFPGAGKLTIGQQLQAMLPAILVDNHLINNVVFSLIDPDGKTKLPEAVWVNVRRIREVVFDTLKNLSRPQRNFITTNALVEGVDRDEEHFEAVHELADSRDARFVVVRLHVDPDELCSRIGSPGRAGMFKDIDVESCRVRAAESNVLIPKSCGYFDLDVTSLTANQSARKILEVVRDYDRDASELGKLKREPPRR
jgi:hypothetical protein